MIEELHDAKHQHKRFQTTPTVFLLCPRRVDQTLDKDVFVTPEELSTKALAYQTRLWRQRDGRVMHSTAKALVDSITAEAKTSRTRAQ